MEWLQELIAPFTNISSSDSHPGGSWPQPGGRVASSQSTSLGSQGWKEAESLSGWRENPYSLTSKPLEIKPQISAPPVKSRTFPRATQL